MLIHKLLKILVVTTSIIFVNCQNNYEDINNKSSEENEIVSVNGDDYDEERKNNVTILQMTTKTDNIGDIDFILNFPNLESLYIEQYNLIRVPVFANLPNLKKISLMKNELRTITNASFSTLRIVELYLARNKIKEIYTNSFGSTLKELFLTCNDLEVFSNKWFTNPQALEQLHLAGNAISVIREDSFKNFTRLKHLDLQLNSLRTIQDNSFSDLSSIQYLKLGYNLIDNFPGEIFGVNRDVFHLTYLDFTYNQLSFLPPSFFSKLRIDNFIIWANPWQCACKKEIKNWWLKNNNYNVTNLNFNYDTPCITPPSFGNICVIFKEEYVYSEFKKIFKPIPLKLCEKSVRNDKRKFDHKNR